MNRVLLFSLLSITALAVKVEDHGNLRGNQHLGRLD
jgi:hypothetical protein